MQTTNLTDCTSTNDCEPTTPRKSASNDDLKQILSRLQDAGLALSLPPAPISPSRRQLGLAGNIEKYVQHLFWKGRPLLDTIIDSHLAGNQDGKPKSWQELEDALSEAVKRIVLPKPSSVAITINNKRRSPTTDEGSLAKRTKQQKISALFSSVKAASTSKTLVTEKSQAEPDATVSEEAVHPHVSALRSGSGTISRSTTSSFNSCISKSTLELSADTSFTTVDTEDDVAESQYGGFTQDEAQLIALTETPSSSTSFQQSHNGPRESLKRSASTSTLPDQGPWLARCLAHSNLCSFKLDPPLRDLPFIARWLIYHAVTQLSVTLDSLLVRLRVCGTDMRDVHAAAYAWIEECLPDQLSLRGKAGFKVDLNPRVSYKSSSFNAHPDFFYFESSPLDAGSISTRLGRRFGPDRFLKAKLTLPSKRSLDGTGCDSQSLKDDAFVAFAMRPQVVLGTTFQLIKLEAFQKSAKDRKDRNERKTDAYSLLYFATSGPGLNAISLREVLDWLLSIADNGSQPFHKLYSRVDLSTSQTMPGVVFKPSQIRRNIPGIDILADGTLEATIYDDPQYPADNHYDPTIIMNDGCARISPAAARQICKQIGFIGIRPSTFQGRINNAKGLWTVAGPYDSCDEAIWIEISDSQTKVQPRRSDLYDGSAEEGIWSLDLVTHSKRLTSSNLHVDFMPILSERGVPLAVLHQVVKGGLSAQFGDLKDAILDSKLLRKWLAGTHRTKEARSREQGIRWSGSQPMDLNEQANMLLEAGFDVRSDHALAAKMAPIIRGWMDDMINKLAIPLPQSCMPFGIADFTGCLQPGEVFMQFSEPFGDPLTREPVNNLIGDVLVARHPAMRHSDIQRVKAVYKSELAHIRDVVVFSSKGCVPLASKLQGGDYDGDTFWICFDQRLVQPFKNAAAPRRLPDPSTFGIVKDQETFSDVLDRDDGTFSSVIAKMVQFRLQRNLLGDVSNRIVRHSYATGNIIQDNFLRLVDLHDTIIDSTKNGYTFDQVMWSRIMKECSPGVSVHTVPAHEQARKDFLKDLAKGVKHSPKHDSIVDTVVIDHVIPAVHQLLDHLEVHWKVDMRSGKELEPQIGDHDLLRPYEQLKDRARTDDLADVQLRHLLRSVENLCKSWTTASIFEIDRMSMTIEYEPSSGSSNNTFHTRIQDYVERYAAIMPLTTTATAVMSAAQPQLASFDAADPQSTIPDPALRPRPQVSSDEWHWLQEHAPGEPSSWDKTKASVLYHLRVTEGQRRYDKRENRETKQWKESPRTMLAFMLAGDVLCYLKAHSRPHARTVAEEMYTNFKWRVPKRSTMHKGVVRRS